MNDEKLAYNLRTIRDLLVFAFTVDELRGLFYFAQNQELRPVADRFAPADNKDVMAYKIIEYCQSRLLFDELLAEVKRANPYAYERFEKELGATVTNAESASPGSATEPTSPDTSTNRILVLAANPKDVIRLRLEEEIRDIEEALQLAEYRDRFELVQQSAVRVKDLQRHLLRYRPDIAHFSGHGSEENEIILEGTTGMRQPVSTRALSGLFSALQGRTRCVVLNACYSEPQAQAIAEYVDCVIGMSEKIKDVSSIAFSPAFYQALAFGESVKTAFDLGCVQIDLENLKEQDIPKLIALRANPEEIFFVEK